MGNPDVIIIPGTKSAIADLALLRQTGLAEGIIQRALAGTPVIGICGGFQMLGKRIEDPQQVESPEGSVPGLGLLDMVTVFEPVKSTFQVKARIVSHQGLFEGLEGEEITGYEIHMGQSMSHYTSPVINIIQRGESPCDSFDGMVDEKGRVFGTYLHGLFDNANFRHGFLAKVRQRKGLPPLSPSTVPIREEQYNRLAEVVRQSLNMELVYQLCGLSH